MIQKNYIYQAVNATFFLFFCYTPLKASQVQNNHEKITQSQKSFMKVAKQFVKDHTKKIVGGMIGAMITLVVGGILLNKSKKGDGQRNRKQNQIETNDLKNYSDKAPSKNDSKSIQEKLLKTAQLPHEISDASSESKQDQLASNIKEGSLNKHNSMNNLSPGSSRSTQYKDRSNKKESSVNTKKLKSNQASQVIIGKQNHHQSKEAQGKIKDKIITNDSVNHNNEQAPLKTKKLTSDRDTQPIEDNQNHHQNSGKKAKLKPNITTMDTANHKNEEQDRLAIDSPFDIETEKPHTWKEKEDLFSLSAIKSMSDRIKNKILEHIDKGDEKAIYSLVYNNLGSNEELKQKKLQEINQKLSKTYHNLRSLCSEVIEQRPLGSSSLLYHWILEKQKKDYFTNKTLKVQLDEQVINHPIQSFEFINNQKDNIHILLIDEFNTSVEVAKKEKNQYQVSIAQKKEKGFFETLLKVNKSDKSKEISIIKKNNFSCSLSEGHYSVLSFQEVSNGSSTHDQLLKKLYSTQESYQQPASYDNLKVVEIKSCEEEATLFRIGIFVAKNKQNIVGISVEKNNTEVAYWYDKYLLSEILISYKMEEVKTKVKLLSAEEFQNSIEINNRVDYHAIDIQNRKKVNSLEQILLNRLLDAKDYHDHLVNILIQKGNIDLKDLQQPHKAKIADLEEKIQYIINFYKDKLSEKVTATSILSRLVEKTLMSSITRKSSSVNEALLERLRKVHQLTEELKKKNIVLIVGNEGAGKSTVTNFLIGTELVKFSNELGEEVFKKKKKSTKSPTIGQRSSAETLYARGFKVKKEDREEFPSLIVDCPGFGDTRSPSDKLCDNIGMDQIVLKSGALKGIVLVVPLNAFLIDKGNSSFQLMQIMQEKFPDVFQLDSPSFKYVHILVTKHNQSIGNIITEFRRGNRFSKILVELYEQKNNIIKTVEDFQQQKKKSSIIEKKIEIWELIRNIQQSDRMHLVRFPNHLQRERLLLQYGNVDGEVNKSSYQTALQTHQVNEVSTLLKESFLTWEKILGEYNALIIATQNLQQQEKNIKNQIKQIKSNLINLSSPKKIKEKEEEQKIKEKELSENNLSLDRAKQKKKKYAFVIIKKYDEPRFLTSLAKSFLISIQAKQGNEIDKNQIYSTKLVYEKFSEYYKEHFHRLYTECKKDLEGSETLKHINQKHLSLDSGSKSGKETSDSGSS